MNGKQMQNLNEEQMFATQLHELCCNKLCTPPLVGTCPRLNGPECDHRNGQTGS